MLTTKGDMPMAKLIWTRYTYEKFVYEALLSDFEQEVLQTRIKGMTVLQQAEHLHCSKSTVEKTISVLKKKYDEVQKRCPDLPVRRASAQEQYMDTH